MSKGRQSSTSSSTSTERSSTTYAPWIQQGQQDVAGSAFNMAENFLRASPFARAAMTADQLRAMDMSRVSAKDAFTSGGNLINPGAQNANMLINAPALTSGNRAATMNASAVDGAGIQGLLNPYLDTVLSATQNNARREYSNADAALQSKYAAAQALGGSGEALARAQLARGYAGDAAQTAAGIKAQGFDRASQLALANAQMQQQANAANMGAQNAVAAQNMDAWLKVPQVNSQLLDAKQRRELQAAQAILAGGNQQQAFAQSVFDAPWTALARLQGTIPQVYDSNRVAQRETQTEGGGGGIGSLLGGAGSFMSGFANLFSDERAKVNKQPLGRDPQTGLLMYAYDYKSDVENAKKSGDPMPPKRVGPMAQDIERQYPGTTRDMGGKMAVDVGLLSKMLSKKA